MADPQILYVVSAVVAMALVAWVIVVNAKAPPLPYARKNVETVSTAPAAPTPAPAAASTPPAATSEIAGAPKKEQPSASEEPEGSDRKSKLDAHLEIQDEQGGGKPGEG
jgi:cell division protein FtsN